MKFGNLLRQFLFALLQKVTQIHCVLSNHYRRCYMMKLAAARPQLGYG
jgi:hypothetical protein